MTQDGRGKTCHHTRPKRYTQVLEGAEVLLGLWAHLLVDGFGTSLIDGELTDSVWDLFGENGNESGVERSDTFGG